MRKVNLILLLLLLLYNKVYSQSCDVLSISASTTESRCLATGSVNITVNGGSGNYNYKINGPVSTNFTSTSYISGLSAGTYEVIVKDLNSGCIKTINNIVVNGSYIEPQFQLTKKNETCAFNNGEIKVENLQNGLSPFKYTIVAPSPSNAGMNNNTGLFTNLSPGEYFIRMEDSCGTIRMRQTTIIGYNYDFGFTVDTLGCDSVSININASPADSFYFYGAVVGVDTIWSEVKNIVTSLNKKPFIQVLIKDICGNIKSKMFNVPATWRPRVLNVDNYFYCSDWDATVSTIGFKNPTFCAYDSTGALIGCNTTGKFEHLPYGSYCFKVSDNCYDTTVCVVRDSAAVYVQLDSYDYGCNSFTLNVPAMPVGGKVCLYDSTGNNLVGCNETGWFYNVPYGTYCAYIFDPCSNETYKVCEGFFNPNVLQVSTYAACNFDSTVMKFNFSNTNAPYNINVYNENNTLIRNFVADSNSTSISLPIFSKYKITSIDNCGYIDSTFVLPTPLKIVKNIEITNKCAGATWVNGSADVKITNAVNGPGIISPRIIKKNNENVTINANDQKGSDNFFYDLEPATYIVKYNIYQCPTEVYDTFTIKPYKYPMQGSTAFYRCDDNSFSVSTTVTGGVAPYTYEIIGSSPTSPSILSSQINNPVFNINNGTTYTMVRLRTIDGCGNSSLKDISLLPFENITIQTDSTCFYRSITLKVDSIANAKYLWYRKTTETDSTFVGDSSKLFLPFFVPEQVGIYICKIMVNNSCIERSAYINLNGECGNIFLPYSTRLLGNINNNIAELILKVDTEIGIKKYLVERKTKGNAYSIIGEIEPKSMNNYIFQDKSPSKEENLYRVKIIKSNGDFGYTNEINLKNWTNDFIKVYPNPSNTDVNVFITSIQPKKYIYLLYNSVGQLIETKDLKNTGNVSFQINKKKAGYYILKLINTNDNSEIYHRIIFK